ncbi:MAG: hypothetical protein R3C10_18965 [Pirellulales bacterium]
MSEAPSNTLLNDDQKRRAVEVMHAYLNAPPRPDGRTPLEAHQARDVERVRLIDEELGPLLEGYLSGRTELDEFKSKIDSINKRHTHWGFKGIKGQMFFNMLVNMEDAECDSELKAALTVPQDEGIARSRMKSFVRYVERIGDDYVKSGGTKHRIPRFRSVPFFLSYFWQIQDRDAWPVFYTNSVKTMADLNLWQPTKDLAEDYIQFKNIHEELAVVFAQASGRNFGLYDVEHVFWFKGGNPYERAKVVVETDSDGEIEVEVADDDIEELVHLPESYVPPVVAILPRMSQNDASLVQAAKDSGTSIERAFEKSINAAFTILGYEVKLLGQGQGRVPDGIAVDADNSYALIWDAKIRGDGYAMGTDDRTIREYIATQSRELKRRQSMRNVYYLVVSSRFRDDFDDLIRGLKLETHINEVCLVEASALVALVDAKLREPREVPLGPDGVQRLFGASGVITSQLVQEMLT